MSLRLPRISRAPNECASSASLRVQHASRAPDLLNVHTSAAHLQSSRAPYLYDSTSTRMQRTAGAPKLHTSMRPTRPYTRSISPELQSSIPLHLHVYAPATHLQNSCGKLLDVPTPAARFQISRPLDAKRQHACGASPDLQGSRGKYLLHVPTPRPDLQGS